MGFWHTGYAEFHESTGLESFNWRSPPPVRYVCEHCAVSFDELERLRCHRFEQHPIRQPTLWLRGRVAGSLPQLVLTPLFAADVVVEDATYCLLNGSPQPLSNLGTRLASMTREFVDLQFENAGVTTKYVLDFQIAEETHLVGVESGFMRLAYSHVLSIDALDRFINECQQYPSAMPYCDGICHYFYGVMAKERAPDSGLKHAQYVEYYSRSSEKLSSFNRPLAHSIRALIAFHFNQFGEAERLASEGALRNAAAAFASLLQGMPWHFDTAFSPKLGSMIEDLLTDQDTLQILSDTCLGLVDLKTRANELLAHHRRSPSGGFDHMKRTILATEAFATCEDDASHNTARRLARTLAQGHDTSDWAEAMLKRLSTS